MGTSATKEVTFEAVSANKNFSVRRYPAAVVAEAVPLGKYVPDVEEGIEALSEYFGLKSSPKNSAHQTIPMSTPYLMSINDEMKPHDLDDIQAQVEGLMGQPNEALASEAPGEEKVAETKDVTTQDPWKPSILTYDLGYVSFFLPSEFTDPDMAPEPFDKRIELKMVPSRIVATRTFHGHFSKKLVTKHASKLFTELVASNLLTTEVNGGPYSYTVAQYTLGRQFGYMDKLGAMMRNEIWVSLSEENPAVQALIAAHDASATPPVAPGASSSTAEASGVPSAVENQGVPTVQASGGESSSSAGQGLQSGQVEA